ALYGRIVHLPIPFFDATRIGELNSRLTSDVSQLQDVLSVSLAEFFRQLSVLLLGTVLIFLTSPQMALFMLSTFPVLVIIAVVLGRGIRKLSKKNQDQLAESNVIIEETLQAIQVVKAFTNEWFETNRYKSSLQRVVQVAIKASRVRALFVSVIIFTLFGGIVLILWYGTNLLSKGEITIGDLMSFVLYTSFIGASVAGLGEMYSQIQKSVGASDRIRGILKEPTEELDFKENRKKEARLKGQITFSNVTFSYPTRQEVPVLKGIDFEVASGEKVALVGHSGAGKSTIIQLLLKFYPTSSGTIRLDGKDLTQLPLTSIRETIGIVPQEVLLFGGSIAENIRYGNPQATDEELRIAAEKAHAMEFIRKFPEGMDTLVGERGVKLSGGQKQRIAIARAILKNPSILVLDEATSSLDAESEHYVQLALDELMKNRTTIIIAHRLSTIRKANKILVIENGKIAESGAHDTLASMDEGIYSNLLKMQYQLN
ncbi:MAG: ATP-binding cassette domain-containing protein, partial [Cytophagales bacterium]|nr:ATP-binding cassette domain-containing protein [Cytophagales bacterium]